MKDPLRYYIAEGLLGFWCYPDPENFGKFLGSYHGTYYLEGCLSSQYIDGKLHFGVKNPAGEKVMYKVTSDFYLDYATVCHDEDDMNARMNAWSKEHNKLHSEFLNIRDALANV